METLLILTKFWGWYLLIFFALLSLKPLRIKQIFQDLKDEKFRFTVSFLAIIIGLINILLYNIWEPSWSFLITAFGWIALFIGLALFIIPQSTVKLLIKLNVKFVQVVYTLLFLIGIYLLNMAYQVVPY
ncbi:hypothetical protein [Paucihalobacter sp.]|uniref:hypothetical protein n=1 Tax=Paucihalobacter sp. TaxID=2850405 RepID=UPI002FE0F793